jgi:aminopeptidase C
MKLRDLIADDQSEAAARKPRTRSCRRCPPDAVHPPRHAAAKFDWQWKDKDKQFHRDGEMTPREFAEKYITLPLDEYVCLVHDPRPSSPTGRTFTVAAPGQRGRRRAGEVPERRHRDDERSTMKTLVDGEPVWFGCDVGPMMQRDSACGTRGCSTTKACTRRRSSTTRPSRLTYHQTFMTHAMLFTGVDVTDDQTPRRWRVENSPGAMRGRREGLLRHERFVVRSSTCSRSHNSSRRATSNPSIAWVPRSPSPIANSTSATTSC